MSCPNKPLKGAAQREVAGGAAGEARRDYGSIQVGGCIFARSQKDTFLLREALDTL